MSALKKAATLFIVLIILSSGLSAMCADDIIYYQLNPNKVDNTFIGQSTNNEYYVSITLNEKSKKELQQLTQANIGKRLKVTLSGDVVIEAIIRETIDSGKMTINHLKTLDSAERLVNRILNRP